MTQLQWYLGRKAAKANLKGLFVVFVDLDRWSKSPVTECYVVPSAFIYDYCKRWIDQVGMVRLHISPDQMEQFRGAWHLIKDALKEEEPKEARESLSVASPVDSGDAPAGVVVHL